MTKTCIILLMLGFEVLAEEPRVAQNSQSTAPHNEPSAAPLVDDVKFPDLSYGGYGRVKWSSDLDSAKRNIDTTEMPSFPGRDAKGRLIMEERGGMERAIVGVAFAFCDGVTNRSERLKVFQSLTRQLKQVYKAPTRVVKGEENVRGVDAYVQGLDKSYSKEWCGPKTVVVLSLSDKNLSVEYKQSNASAQVNSRLPE